jgi:hypothetical protein
VSKISVGEGLEFLGECPELLGVRLFLDLRGDGFAGLDGASAGGWQCLGLEAEGGDFRCDGDVLLLLLRLGGDEGGLDVGALLAEGGEFAVSEGEGGFRFLGAGLGCGGAEGGGVPICEELALALDGGGDFLQECGLCGGGGRWLGCGLGGRGFAKGDDWRGAGTGGLVLGPDRNRAARRTGTRCPTGAEPGGPAPVPQGPPLSPLPVHRHRLHSPTPCAAHIRAICSRVLRAGCCMLPAGARRARASHRRRADRHPRRGSQRRAGARSARIRRA